MFLVFRGRPAAWTHAIRFEESDVIRSFSGAKHASPRASRHIVPIHRAGEADGYVYFAMSYVPGETLGERLRRAGPVKKTPTPV